MTNQLIKFFLTFRSPLKVFLPFLQSIKEWNEFNSGFGNEPTQSNHLSIETLQFLLHSRSLDLSQGSDLSWISFNAPSAHNETQKLSGLHSK